MKNHAMTMVSSQLERWNGMMLFAACAALVWTTTPARAATGSVPWECSRYSEEAQTRCMNAFIEQQREQIERLEGQLRDQRDAVGRLRGQLDQQAAATSELQQQLSQRPAAAIVPAPYIYSYAYAYPPVGLGLYLGRPWIYGPPYIRHPYWGPRFYGRWGHRW